MLGNQSLLHPLEPDAQVFASAQAREALGPDLGPRQEPRKTQPLEETDSEFEWSHTLDGSPESVPLRRRRSPTRQTALDSAAPLMTEAARAHADLLAAVRAAGSPRGAHDLIIAATAVETERIVVTADARGFEGLPSVDVRVV